MRSRKQETELRIYKRHELKVLNFSLVLYICLGALLFHSLGEFEDSAVLRQRTQKQQQQDNNRKEEKLSLKELRLNSVRRMWNITNQLNILYESNWTLLVLDELVEFEKSFLEALSSSNRQESADNTVEDDDDGADDVDENQNGNDKSDKEKENSRKRRKARSIQRSLIHSLATVTTIGSPNQIGSLRLTQTGKLLTLIYGTLGIPLLIYTLSRSGRKLAHSSLNFFLILRHYLFSLPFHYLCCSCNLTRCFTWLNWCCCCCCCCCSYLFGCCCLNQNNNKEAKRKCCDTKNAPKLLLYKRKHRGVRRVYIRPIIDGATESTYQHQTSSDPAINTLNHYRDQQQEQYPKSVRFKEQQGSKVSFMQIDSQKFKDENETDCDDESSKLHYQDENVFSYGLFIISLLVLSSYLSIGAYFYSLSQNTSLIDGFFTCYEMISGSRLPDVLSLASPVRFNLDPSSIYSHLLDSNTRDTASYSSTNSTFRGNKTSSMESFIWNLVYMIGGLHLVSMCANFAQLWISGEYSGNLEVNTCSTVIGGSCNGKQIPALMMESLNIAGGEYGDEEDFRNPLKTIMGSVELTGETSMGIINHLKTDQLYQHQPMQTISSSLVAADNLIVQQQQHPSQVDLAELFLASHHNSPSSIHIQQHHLLTQQHQQPQTSDISLASTDRSTDRASLCLHHQAQLPTSSTSEASLYHHQHHHHHHHPHQHHHQHQQPQPQETMSMYDGQQQILHNHIYLPSLSISSDQQQRLESTGEDDDDDEMALMLKSCINGTAGRSRSSSIQFSHSNGQLSSIKKIAQNGFHPNQTPSTLSRLYATDVNGCNSNEQDSSLTTNSNTISSINSRSIKVPQRLQLANAVGYTVDQQQPSYKNNNNNGESINKNTLERL